jgi:hypothetical protein
MDAGAGWLPTSIAAFAAVAAAVSAWFSRQALERSHRPYVWPEWKLLPPGGEAVEEREGESDDAYFERFKATKFRVGVRLHNDGPGIALDPMWTIQRNWVPTPHAERPVPPISLPVVVDLYRRRRFLRRTDRDFTASAREAAGVRALPAGEQTPTDGWQTSFPYRYAADDYIWSILVRYSDSAGRRWEFEERRFTKHEVASRPRRVRRRLRRGDTDHRWRWRYEW